MTTNEKNTRKARRFAISMAKYMVADEAFNETPKRWIRKEEDFNGDDIVTISEYTEKIMNLLEEKNGHDWDDVLKGIRNISKNFFFGFRAQDNAIKDLAKCGYNFNI